MLRKRLEEAQARVDQAERVAEEMHNQLKASAAEKAQVDTDPGVDDTTSLVHRLKAENRRLHADLEEARSHIFSLQPYRRDLMPEEVGREFDDLVTAVGDWTAQWAEPIVDDPEAVDDLVAEAKRRPSENQRLRKYLQHANDLIRGSAMSDTDIDVIIGLIWRFLFTHIFSSVLFGSASPIAELVCLIEESMCNLEPARDLFSIREWRAETLNAVIATGNYQQAKAPKTQKLAFELASILRFLRGDQPLKKLAVSLYEAVLVPAIALHEKLQTSTHHYYLDLNHTGNGPTAAFLADLPNLRCENLLQNRKVFNVLKLDPQPSGPELRKNLMLVASTVPALYMRQVGRGSTIKDPVLVRKQQVLVAWGTEEQREQFMSDNGPTLVDQLLCAAPTGNGWSAWRNLV